MIIVIVIKSKGFVDVAIDDGYTLQQLVEQHDVPDARLAGDVLTVVDEHELAQEPVTVRPVDTVQPYMFIQQEFVARGQSVCVNVLDVVVVIVLYAPT